MLNLCSLARKPKRSGRSGLLGKDGSADRHLGRPQGHSGSGGQDSSTGLPGDSLGHGCQLLGLSGEEALAPAWQVCPTPERWLRSECRRLVAGNPGRRAPVCEAGTVTGAASRLGGSVT